MFLKKNFRNKTMFAVYIAKDSSDSVATKRLFIALKLSAVWAGLSGLCRILWL